MVMAQADIAAAEGKMIEAKGALQQAQDELDTKQELKQRNAGVVAEREIERLTISLDGRKGAVAGAEAAKQAAETRLSTCCPRKRPAPRPPSSRHRSSSTRPSSTPASRAWWSSSRCASAKSSIRSCARRAC